MLEFDQIQTFFIVLAGLGAFVVLFGNVIDRIQRWVKPGMDIHEKLKEHDRMLDNDNKRFREMEELVKLNTRATFAMLDHMISGNDTSKMQEVRDDMNNHLLSR